ncbi:MAG: carbon-nitrogen family hydrolase [Acidaminococcaceae bacterium]|nr:carbon-nitrogen family hydrolase [Acidaminococcaceae bacterium]
MKIALIQMQVREHATQANTGHGLELLRAAAAHSDLAVLPEIWNTGYSLSHLEAEAVEEQSNLCSQLKQIAREQGCAIIAGSVPFRSHGRIYNASLAIDKFGRLVNIYGKAHLFGMFHEENFFAPGEHFDCFTLDGISCGSTICYDLRFPELYRRQALEGAKIIFVPAEWPVQRGKIWDLLLKARAVENHLFIVGVNCVGTFKQQHFYGHSQLIDPEGNILVCGSDREEILYGELDLAKLDQVRQVLNVLPDVRPELVKVPAGFLKKETGL